MSNNPLDATGFNKLIDDLTEGVDKATLVLENKALIEQIEELADLCHEQDEELTTLRAVCIFHNLVPAVEVED